MDLDNLIENLLDDEASLETKLHKKWVLKEGALGPISKLKAAGFVRDTSEKDPSTFKTWMRHPQAKSRKDLEALVRKAVSITRDFKTEYGTWDLRGVDDMGQEFEVSILGPEDMGEGIGIVVTRYRNKRAKELHQAGIDAPHEYEGRKTNA